MSEDALTTNQVLAKIGASTWIYIGLKQAPKAADLRQLRDNAESTARPSLLSTNMPDELLFGRRDDKGKIFYASNSKAEFLCRLRVLENTNYHWEIFTERSGELQIFDESELPQVTASLSQSNRSGVRWESDNRQARGQFNFGNFLGAGWIKTDADEILRFEVISAKIGYEVQYLALLSDLIEKSIALLFDSSAPTSTQLILDTERKQETELEAFLLMQAALPIDKLRSSLALIKSRPDCQLKSETKWQPASISTGIYAMRDPIGRIRWAKEMKSGKVKPTEVLEQKRKDDLNTPPNQFIKAALERFFLLASNIRNRPDQYGQRISKQAAEFEAEISTQLRSELMKGIGPLLRLPFDNQVLQKREGYRQMLGAWIASSGALSIRDTKRGGLLSPTAENRQVPDLYEYWLFFFLAEALEGLNGASDIDKTYLRELNPGGRVSVALTYKDTPRLKLKHYVGGACRYIALYYNRSFTKGQGYTSYSLTLRPDYTIETFPEKPGQSFEESQKAAAATGEITYIHFDAKFRIHNLDLSKAGDSDEEDVEKDEAAKPEDIYKMHTYNEAIRGTAASVILFPGEKTADSDLHSVFPKYHELIPGVGVLSIRPGESSIRMQAIDCVRSFLTATLALSPQSTSSYSKFRNWELSEVKKLQEPSNG